MEKFDYFKTLEELSASAVSAVYVVCCTGYTKKEKSKLCAIRLSADKYLYELEDALFSDFLPPLDRASFASCAHSLSRIIDRASELYSSLARLPPHVRDEVGQRLCIRLCEILHGDVTLLRKIRKPEKMPSHRAFRALSSKGCHAYTEALAKINSGRSPKSLAAAISVTAKLRAEISRAYDTLLEIMLNNI